MPRDGKLPARAPLQRGLAGLAQLRDELRKPMPVGREWAFEHIDRASSCGASGCAIGLAMVLWPKETEAWAHGEFMHYEVMAERLGISVDDVTALFLENDGYRCHYDEVTPTMVADEIDKLFREKGYVEGVAI